MDKICFIGNSHLACIKQAYSLESSHGLKDCDFFPSHRNSLKSLHSIEDLQGQKYLTGSSEVMKNFLRFSSSDKIKLSDYSTFIFVGGTSGNNPNLYWKYFNPCNECKPPLNVTLFLFKRAILDNWIAGPLTVLANNTNKEQRILYCPPPLPTSLGLPAGFLNLDSKLVHNGASTIYQDLNKARIQIYEKTIPIVLQPSLTISPDCISTKKEYSRGSIRLNGLSHNQEDCFHMNSNFGILQLQNIEKHFQRKT